MRIAIVGDVHDRWGPGDEVALSALQVDLVLFVVIPAYPKPPQGYHRYRTAPALGGSARSPRPDALAGAVLTIVVP